MKHTSFSLIPLEKENDLNEAASILAEITRRYNNTKNGGNE